MPPELDMEPEASDHSLRSRRMTRCWEHRSLITAIDIRRWIVDHRILFFLPLRSHDTDPRPHELLLSDHDTPLEAIHAIDFSSGQTTSPARHIKPESHTAQHTKMLFRCRHLLGPSQLPPLDVSMC